MVRVVLPSELAFFDINFLPRHEVIRGETSVSSECISATSLVVIHFHPLLDENNLLVDFLCEQEAFFLNNSSHCNDLIPLNDRALLNIEEVIQERRSEKRQPLFITLIFVVVR